MATPDLLKQLEVKKNVIARTMKDLQLYRQEELDERAKVDKLKANNADPYDIKSRRASCKRPSRWCPTPCSVSEPRTVISRPS